MNLLILFGSFFKIGIFGYGGGTGMLPLIFQTVRDLGLVTEKQFADLVAVSQVT
ncbi:MAG: chromate transporter, partial [Firmicutes bacterium]|nr:chromate transporter [Bacillota bacterium]